MFDLTSTGAHGRPPAPMEPQRGGSSMPVGDLDGGPDWRRAISALRRHVWLIGLGTMLAGMAGWYASRLIVPLYAARTRIWIDESGRGAGRSPLAPSDLFDAQGWVQLLTSDAVLDSVVAQLHLFVGTPAGGVDPRLFDGVIATSHIQPGRYTLGTDSAGTHFVLTDVVQKRTIETVPVGDSVGRSIGLAWKPPADLATPGRTYLFTLRLPLAVAQGLGGSLQPSINQQASLLTISMMGASPTQTATILNAVANRYVALAKTLQHERLTQQTNVLAQQVSQASQSLAQAEKELEAFKVRTITLPHSRAAGGMPAASDMGGADPAVSRFNDAQGQLAATRTDLGTVERLIRVAVDDSTTLSGFEGLPVVSQSPSLVAAFKDLDDKEARLNTLLERYKEAYPEVVQLRREISQVRRGTIPQLAAGLLDELSRRAKSLSTEVAETADSLRLIPQRETAEARLLRNVSMTTSLYNTLQQKYDEALIAQATNISDVRILDPATIPPYPTKNTKSRVILLALVAGFGLASVGAILRDRMDPRFRYPEQVSRDMGVTILGSVPRTKVKADGALTDPAFRDSIRGVRMNLSYAYGAAGPVTFAITSPGGSDGKSFISLHLARTFAEMGRRTILIDGDVRRGVLHRRCHVTRRPGLIDYLNGDVELDNVIQATPFPNCFLVPSGTRVTEAPELLGSPAMQRMMAELRTRFDVIICDTAPLSAGIDSFLLGAVAGNLMLVIRPGVSLRQVLQTKLEVLDRMPIRLLGAVLNAVPDSAPYLYYSHYLPGYETASERLGQGAGGKLPTGAG